MVLDLATFVVRRASPGDAAAVGELLVEGLIENPFWQTVDGLEHQDAVRDILTRRALSLVPVGYVIEYEGEVIGHFAMSPSDFDSSPSWWEILWTGAWLLPLKHGRDFMSHFHDLLRSTDAATGPILHAHGPHDLLQAFVIKQEWRGLGIGSHVMRTSIVGEAARKPILLMTQEESNVRLYERLGFAIIDQRSIVTSHGRAYPNWTMARQH